MPEAFKRYRFMEKLTSFVPGNHRLLDKLPEPYRSKAIIFGYKLGLVPTLEYFKFQQYKEDGKTPVGTERITCNIITDIGAGIIRDILAASFAGAGTNKQAYMDFGTGTGTPVVGSLDVEGVVTGAPPRLSCTVTSPGSYEVRCEAFIDGTWGTRAPDLDQLNNFGLFTHASSGEMVSHAKIVPGVDVVGAGTAKGTYGILVR